MLAEVTKSKVKILEYQAIHQGEYNVNKCSFNLPDYFEGLQVCACFNNIPVPLVNGECVIPSLEYGTAVLGVYAYKENAGSLELMYSPEPTAFCVLKGSFSEEVNREAVPEISVYEQYCTMIKGEYEQLQRSVVEAELLRQAAEKTRESSFLKNETQRQAIFETNERIRQAEFDGAYTNLLGDIAEESSTTANPTQFPAHKTNIIYENTWAFAFYKGTNLECYVFEAKEGDRFNISNCNTNSSVPFASILASDFSQISRPTNIADLCTGVMACPENTAYIVINKAIDGYTPVVTRVDEPVVKSEVVIPKAQKMFGQMLTGEKHYVYHTGIDAGITLAVTTYSADQAIYSSGIYPLEAGKEYIVCYNESVIPVNALCGYICDENLTTNTVIQDISLDDCARYIFTATENDKYIALNCFGFDGNFQFGESKSEGSQKIAKIGNALFDGKNDISLGEIGGIDRSLVSKKWVSYGDSITYGSKLEIGEKRWQDYIIERYSIGLHKNMGVGSTSIGYKEGVSLPAMCTDDRLNGLIAENPDIVTILGGANDLSYDIPIGADEDIVNKNTSTFKGAYAYIVDKILSAKPDTVIVLMGMYLCADDYYGNSHIHSIKEYRAATRNVAEYFGLPFVDLNECGFNSYNFNKAGSLFSTDGIHPNAEGVKRIAMVVSKWFDTFKGTIY